MNKFTQITALPPKSARKLLTAYALSDALKQIYGYSLPVSVSDRARENSIIIADGNTDYGFEIYNENNDLIIKAKDFYGYDAALCYLKAYFGDNGDSADAKLCVCGSVAEEHTPDRSTYYIHNRSGDLRAMSFNIYGWGGKGGTALRTELEQELMMHYKPDVVGFQEFGDYMDFAYRSTMTPKLLEIGYREVPFWYSERKSNSTPIFYAPDRVELVAEDSFGGLRFSNGMKDTSKSLTWAAFREKRSERSFIFISTHFMWPDPRLAPEITNTARVSDACELLDKIKQLRKIYGKDIPIIAGGDLNCLAGTDPVNKLLSGGLEWFYDIAATSLEYGYHGYSIYDEEKKYYTKTYEGPKDAEKSMDFMFGSGEMSVESYITVTDTLALISSDHCPKLADISLKK